jgi:hypothetical protein
MNEQPKTAVRFRAPMPQIPGLAKEPPQPQAQQPPQKAQQAPQQQPQKQQQQQPQQQTIAPDAASHPPRMWSILVVAAFLVSAASGAWWILHGRSGVVAPPQTVTDGSATAPTDAVPEPPVTRTVSNEIGTISEFPKAWDAKKFTYSQPLTREQIPAMVVRLPGGSARSAAAYWGILLQTPLGRCELQYISDEKSIAKQFGVDSGHPMVVDPCDGSVYDPLRMGTLGDGSWARGELVKGNGGRPPLGIEIHIKGNELIAGQAEQ